MNAKKKALGRGLSALLEDYENFDEASKKEVIDQYKQETIAPIPIEQIETNPFQPRSRFEEETLLELANSIKEQGIIQPITVRKFGHNKYQLITGERRLKASKMAELKEIPAYIRVANDQQVLEMALVENIQRENLNPLEIAISYIRLIEECKLTQEDLSKKVGKDRSTIANYTRLLKLPAEIQIAIRDNAITMGHARALINIENTAQQLQILKSIIEKQLSVREVESMVRNIDHPKEKTKNMPTDTDVLPSKYSKAKKQLEKRLNTSVEIKINNKGKGNISIPFTSEQQLDNIISLLDK